MKNAALVSVVALLAMGFGGLVSTVSAAGGFSNEATLYGEFNFGDISGNYSTSGQQMYANLGVSSGQITAAFVFVDRAAWLDVPGKTYFQVNVEIEGNYSTLPVLFDGMYQNQSATHNGVSIDENVSLGSYQANQIWETASCSATLSPFTVISADGNFNDSSWTDGTGDTHDWFDYNVVWRGYTTDSTASVMFGSVGPVGVPEPATVGLLILGFGGLVARRRRNK